MAKNNNGKGKNYKRPADSGEQAYIDKLSKMNNQSGYTKTVTPYLRMTKTVTPMPKKKS